MTFGDGALRLFDLRKRQAWTPLRAAVGLVGLAVHPAPQLKSSAAALGRAPKRARMLGCGRGKRYKISKSLSFFGLVLVVCGGWRGTWKFFWKFGCAVR